MDPNRKEDSAKQQISRIASPAVRSSRTSASSQSGMTTPRSRKSSANTVAGSAECGMTTPRAAGATSLRRHSLRRGYSQSRRRKMIKRKRLRNAVVILEREKDRLESEATRISASLVRITCKNVIYFVLLYSAVLCVRAGVTTYLEGVSDELRKKYALSDNQLALVQGTQLIGMLASLLVVALFGRIWHKPLLLTVGVLVASLGTMVCAVPYFVEKASGAVQTSCAGYVVSTEGVPLTSYAQVCQYGQWNSSYVSPCSPCLTNPGLLDWRQTILSILCIAGFLVGVGTGTFVTTGFVYLEESGYRKNGPIYYGVLLSMTGFGHFLGSCVTWWFLGYTEDLQDSDDVQLSWKVKAWWVGFVFFSILLFLFSPFFLFFPKWITEPDWSANARRRRLRLLEKRIEQERALRKLRRERRKQRRRRGRLGSVALSCTSESLNDYVLPDHVSSVSETVSSASVPVGCVSPVTETTSVCTGNADGVTEEASSSCSSDEETATNGPEATVSSPLRISGGTGSGLGIIAEEDYGISRLPSSATPAEVDSVERSRLGDNATPVWPLHLSEEDSRQSRVVTFASGVADATGNQSGNLSGYGGTRRKPQTERTPRRQVSKNLGKTFTALKRTILLPVFTLSLVGTALSAYLTAGYRSIVVRFVEVEYGQAPVYAWFYTGGLCYSIAETVGPLIGGIIVHKLRLSLFKQIKMIICLLIINLVLFVLIFPIHLPNGGFQRWQNGNSSSNLMPPSGPTLASACLTKCDCLDVQLDPVCSQDARISYFSACHAGCTQLHLENASIIYSNCSCVAGALASSSFCSNDFLIYGAFWVVLFLAITAHSMGQVSVILIFLRSVREIDRHLALSIAIWVIVVAAFVPGPPVFEALEKTSCTISRSNCFGEETCWLYDLDLYRYVIHAASMAFQLVAICFFSGAFYHLRVDPIEPVGYGKEEVRSGIGAHQDVLKAKRTEAGNEEASHTMMEMVQSRIALGLLANQHDLMKFSKPELTGSEPERKFDEPELANDPAPSISSGCSDLKAELEARGKEEARRRVSSDDSSVFVNTKVTDSNPAEDAEVTSRRTIFSDQSDDSVFARNNSENIGYENMANDAEPEEDVDTEGSGGRAKEEDKYDSSGRELLRTGIRPEDNEDASSTITDITRL